MNKYSIFQRFGHGHDHYIAEIEGESSKKAFTKAVIKYFEAHIYDKYTEFYVICHNKESDDFSSYGYSVEGQRHSDSKGFRTSIKDSINRILLEENYRKSTEGFEEVLKTLI